MITICVNEIKETCVKQLGKANYKENLFIVDFPYLKYVYKGTKSYK